MGKLLSIAVPCYNVEKYLRKGLESYFDERLKDNLEVLIVNDGSSDSTEKIAREYVEKCPEIFRLINKENGGHGSAVNAGIENAVGKYFRVIDGDDWVHSENLVIFLEKLREIDTDMVIDEKREVHMVTGKTKLFPIPSYVAVDQSCSFEEICTREDIGSYIMIHTLSVKTELLKNNKIKLQEHVFYVDYEFIVKATCLCQTAIFFALEIYQYLVGNVNQSVSSQNYVKRYGHHDIVTKELLRYEKEQGFTGKRGEYLERKVNLIIHTQYNISLIFNKDRRAGRKQAEEFRKFLKENYPDHERKTRKRYYEALILHFLGVDSEKLDKIMGRG